ncbi:MAG: hypothetical protein QF473_36690, partial [Planctomycetota bacterium]|nr:hypothetical protein [Planctomycetota bacterium]
MKHTQIRFTLGLLVVALHPALLSAEAMRLRETREAVGKHISAIRVIQQQILTGVEEFLELNTKDALAVKRADVSARKLCIEELARVKRAPTGGIFGFDDDGKRKERVKAKKERVAVLEKMVTTDDLPGMMREATAVLKREKTSYVRKGYDLL